METPTMPLELVTVETADGVELDGALYAAAAPRKPVGILVVHGLTWNFYRGPSRWLPPLLAGAGYTCLSLNMRDHDLAEPKHFDLAHHDLRAGIDRLAQAGDEVVVVAHGYACNKLACYQAHTGDRRVRRQILMTLGGVKNYRPDLWDEVLRAAATLEGTALVVQGAADQLIEGQARADELAAAAPRTTFDVVMLEGANHYFDDCHGELATCVVGWLDR